MARPLERDADGGHRGGGRRRRCRRLALAGAAIAAPAVAHALILRRLRAPEAPGWGRTHRFAGHLGPVVFQELGAGEPIVLLHAFGPGFDANQWRAVAEALAPRFRVLAPDLPGWGRSAPLAPRPEIYLANLADFLAGVLWSPAVLVAAGHAAPYAVHLAAEHPEMVKGVALVAPLGLHAGGARKGFPAPAASPDAAGAKVGRGELNQADELDELADLDDLPEIGVLDEIDETGETEELVERIAADEEDELDELDEPAAVPEPTEVPQLTAPTALPEIAALDGAGQRSDIDDLEGTAAPAYPLHPLVADLLAVPLLRISVLDALTSRAFLASFLRRHAYAAPERIDAALLEHHYRVSHLPAHRQALAAFWRGELKLSAAATLRHLQVPVWAILGGDADPNRLSADDLPPGSGIEAVAGTRALPHAERPLAVGEALARFLAGLPAS